MKICDEITVYTSNKGGVPYYSETKRFRVRSVLVSVKRYAVGSSYESGRRGP